MNLLKLIMIVVCTIVFVSFCQKGREPVQVTIQNGIIEGFENDESGLETFFGIPFAKPPVGDLRWKAPQPAEDWEGVLETKTFGNRPVQVNVWGDMIYRSPEHSEDCLYLNIWTPIKKGNDRLPVLVYFYGGGYVAGEASEPRYDGASMARQGMVAVTVNYRLNIFGFFAHPELSEESSYGASGNYGLLDQHAALKWVQKNIAAFGGDPKRVTIAGESAGSISVSAQMASPLSKDLIAGAIGESGGAVRPTLAPIPLAEAEQTGKAFAEKAGYQSLAELRALSTEELFKLYNDSGRFGFPTVVDGYFFPKTLPEIFKAGEQAQIPLLLGWTSAEIPGNGVVEGLPYTPENFIEKIKKNYPEHHQQILSLYGHETDAQVVRSATDLASDHFIVYSTWKWFDLHRKHSDQPVYRYLFSRIRPQSDPGAPELLGAPHASDIEYCMGNLPLIDAFPWTEEDYKTSRIMQTYFASFIKTGNPNREGLPEWPAVGKNDPKPPVMNLDSEASVFNAQHDNRYGFWDGYYGN